MIRYFVFFCAFTGYYIVASVNPGPKHPPTKGEVWPKPREETKLATYYAFSSIYFDIKIVNQNCSILWNAVNRYENILRYYDDITKRKWAVLSSRPRRRLCAVGDNDDNYQGFLRKLKIDLLQTCDEYPQFDMDESYDLTVSKVSILRSGSVWGALRGLETFAQLFYLSDDYNAVLINGTTVVDYPRYPHRGLLLDTSRHYMSLRTILATLDAMAMNKMNVFHWHIVDDQSFPYQSEKFPEISQLGAYHPSMVYTKADIQMVINYARDRGIRVVPEFDVPGHVRSWGVAYPNILTKCYQDSEMYGLGPLNPIRNTTYKLLRDLFQEVQEWFPDQYFHIGGDEVDMGCWESNPEIKNYMKAHDITSTSDLHALFMKRAIPLLGDRSKLIAWQEVFDEGVPLAKDALVQVWKYQWIEEMVKVLKAGHKVVFSSSWYLDILRDGFQEMYIADPRRMVREATNNGTLGTDIVGGEACMWGEMADDTNVLSRTWPRASAVAEVLWSEEQVFSDTWNGKPLVPEVTLSRIEEHTCRMIRRGIPAQPPSGPGFCLV